MKKLSDRQKTLIKWLCVLVLVGLIIYVFRDMAGPIMSQLVKTSPVVVAAILGATLLYGVIESCITFILMRQVENNMTFFDANIMTYFVSFYRVSTLGSGTIVASTLFMKHCGIQPSKALGLYSIDYAIHKMTICVMAVALFLANREYMRQIQFICCPWSYSDHTHNDGDSALCVLATVSQISQMASRKS